jgi:NAD(P)-dependent dehydrogenase (short-subunit alcohol dehydrogenase family)
MFPGEDCREEDLEEQINGEIETTMNLELENKKALVTGSTAGIGFAIASRLAREGAEVWVNGRTQERVEKAISEIEKHFPDARLHGIAADLGSAAGCAEVVRQLPEVDVLINNLGIFEPKAFEKISDAEWEKFFAVNVLSGVRLSRAYLAGMKARNWGHIIFISSESALQIPAEMIHYGTTKTAQLAVARGLAETCAGSNVTVNSVLPGPTASEGVTEFVGQLAQEHQMTRKEFENDFFRHARPTSLLQRFIEPNEIASVVAFVCSPLASAINGASVRADGGVIKSIA